MSQTLLYGLSGVALVAICLYAVVCAENLLRKILAVNVMGSGVFMVIGALARRGPEECPDPVAHALVLTGIVVAVSATAFALALACRLFSDTGETTLSDGGGWPSQGTAPDTRHD
jgi:multicomponent Na+:H+ antiporter subunit C